MNFKKHPIKAFLLLLGLAYFAIVPSCLAESLDWEEAMLRDLKTIMTTIAHNKAQGKPDSTYFYEGFAPSGSKAANVLFTPQTIKAINDTLAIMDQQGRKTIIYMGYLWREYTAKDVNSTPTKKEMQGYSKKMEDKVTKILERVQEEFGQETANLNLHIVLRISIKINTKPKDPKAKPKAWDWDLYLDQLHPRADMNSSCRNALREEIKKAVQTKGEGSLGKNVSQAMIWRASLLKAKMLTCPTIPALTGDQSKDLVAMLNYVKAKVANKEKVLLHTAPQTPATLVSEKIKLDNTTYQKIQFKNFTKTNPSFSDPLEYKIELDDKATPKSATFKFFNKDSTDKVLFTIVLYDEKNKEKKDSLEKWLMGEGEVFLKDVKWISQMDKSEFGDETCFADVACCNKACAWILAKSNVSSTRANQVAAMTGNDDCNTLTKASTFNQVISIIEKSIKEHKKPILIGVNHPKCKNNGSKEIPIYETISSCSGNTPSITNHYVVVVGVGYDVAKRLKYIRFYEVGTGSESNGKNESNKLFISKNEASGNTAYKTADNCGNVYYYKLTEVRKNDGYDY